MKESGDGCVMLPQKACERDRGKPFWMSMVQTGLPQITDEAMVFWPLSARLYSRKAPSEVTRASRPTRDTSPEPRTHDDQKGAEIIGLRDALAVMLNDKSTKATDVGIATKSRVWRADDFGAILTGPGQDAGYTETLFVHGASMTRVCPLFPDREHTYRKMYLQLNRYQPLGRTAAKRNTPRISVRCRGCEWKKAMGMDPYQETGTATLSLGLDMPASVRAVLKW